MTDLETRQFDAALSDEAEESPRPWWRPPSGGEELRAWRLRVYPRFAVVGPIAAFIAVMIEAAQSEGARLGGDLPAFYGAGRIAREGNWANLYDAEVQIASQASALPDITEGYLPFAYAPPVAAAYAPLAGLSYPVAFVVHTALMLCCVVAGLWLLRPLSDLLRRRFLLVCMASVIFVPMFRSVVGGQNTAFSFLLVAAILRLLWDDRHVALVVPFTLLLYKPQLALPVMGLCLIARYWRAVGAAIASFVCFWVLGAAVAGYGWFSYWWTSVIEFGTHDEIAAADINVSWRGALADAFGLTGVPYVLGWALAVLTIAVLIATWWPSAMVPFGARAAVLMPGLILISPHAMFYEAGLLVITGLIGLEHGWLHRRALIVLWLYAGLELTRVDLGVHVIFPLVVAAFVLSLEWVATARRANETSGRAKEPDVRQQPRMTATTS